MKAFKSDVSDVVDAWEKHHTMRCGVMAARKELAARLGRGLMVNRLGFGHGTRVVGFEKLPTDAPGDVLADGALRLPKNDYVVRPNARRKAGKDLQAEMLALNEPGPDLPGMPAFHLGGDDVLVGIRSHAPALFEKDGVVYVLWDTDNVEPGSQWESIPLSVYYSVQETL